MPAHAPLGAEERLDEDLAPHRRGVGAVVSRVLRRHVEQLERVRDARLELVGRNRELARLEIARRDGVGADIALRVDRLAVGSVPLLFREHGAVDVDGLCGERLKPRAVLLPLDRLEAGLCEIEATDRETQLLHLLAKFDDHRRIRHEVLPRRADADEVLLVEVVRDRDRPVPLEHLIEVHRRVGDDAIELVDRGDAHARRLDRDLDDLGLRAAAARGEGADADEPDQQAGQGVELLRRVGALHGAPSLGLLLQFRTLSLNSGAHVGMRPTHAGLSFHFFI